MGKFLTRALLVILATGLVLLVFRAFSPPRTRDEGLKRDAGSKRGADRGIPEDVLAAADVPGFAGAMGELGDAYWSMPYAVINESQGIAMVEALTAAILRGDPLPEKLEVTEGQGAGGGNLLYRIQPGVAMMFYGDGSDAPGENVSDADIPLVISQPEPGHGSADVLFADGHLESVAVGRFPLSPGFIAALSELDTPEHAEARNKDGR